jgi:hypothetical protein
MAAIVRCAGALSHTLVLLVVSIGIGCKPGGQRPAPASGQSGLEPAGKSDGLTAVPQVESSASVPAEGSGKPPAADAAPPERPGVFAIGPGVYEFTAPGAELLEETERRSAANITITGGAKLPSPEVTASQARQQVEDIKRGNVAHLGDVVVSWALIVYATPQTRGPVKNPQARPIVVSGLSGYEIRGQRDITWGFPFPDHTLMVTARGPVDRLNSPEVQTILHSLRKTGPIPQELAKRAKSADGQ